MLASMLTVRRLQKLRQLAARRLTSRGVQSGWTHQYWFRFECNCPVLPLIFYQLLLMLASVLPQNAACGEKLLSSSLACFFVLTAWFAELPPTCGRHRYSSRVLRLCSFKPKYQVEICGQRSSLSTTSLV